VEEGKRAGGGKGSATSATRGLWRKKKGSFLHEGKRLWGGAKKKKGGKLPLEVEKKTPQKKGGEKKKAKLPCNYVKDHAKRREEKATPP